MQNSMSILKINIANPQTIIWKEENLHNCRELHIGGSGERIATVTGVTWLTNSILIAAHHCSGKIGFFDITTNKCLSTIEINTRTDDVCVKKSKNKFLISCSATWSGEQVLIEGLITDTGIKTSKPKLIEASDKSFSHGVFFVGNIPSIAFHTGEFPRIQINQDILTLPEGFLPTTGYWDQEHNALYACANKFLPSTLANEIVTEASIWLYSMEMMAPRHELTIPKCHIDKCQIRHNYIWFNNQYENSVVGVNLKDYKERVELKNPMINFPHGIEINDNGVMAVANYKSESIFLFDLDSLLKKNAIIKQRSSS